MPLRAIDTDGRSFHSFLDGEYIRTLPPGSLVCPHCGARFGFRPESKRRNNRYLVTAHFFHITRLCSSAAPHHKESPEHEAAKQLIIAKLQSAYPSYREATAQTEVGIEYEGKIIRIADVMFTFPDGRRVCHEVQLSPQSQHDFAVRTDSYQLAGYDVMWWLGPKVKQHADWCLEELGVVGYVEVDYDDTNTPLGDNQNRAA